MANDLAIPIAFPDFMARSDEIQQDVPSGHAGILFASGATGTTMYFEYGRYDPPGNIGLVRRQTIPNSAARGLSVRALKPALRRLSQASGHGGRLRAAWIEVPDGGFARMKTFAEQRMQMNNNPGRTHYSIASNNCCTFARDVAEAGGAAVGLAPGWAVVLQGTIFPHALRAFGSLALTMSSPIPNAFLTQLLAAHPGVEFQQKDTWTSVGSGDLATN